VANLPERHIEVLRELLKRPAAIRQKHAEIVLADGYALKKIRPQKPADHFRRTFRSQARREAEASRWMLRHGIPAPRIYGYAFNLSPFGGYESLLLMEHIENVGTLRDVLEKERRPERRERLLQQLRQSLERFFDRGIYHKDCHYGNILVGKDERIVWIDNDLAPLGTAGERERFLRKIVHSPLLREEESSIFERLLHGKGP
jgi:tRNA A-37 threonylcarbamoyl transferase component Bud32